MTYEQKIKSLKIESDFNISHLSSDQFVIHQDEKIQIIYAPFDHINTQAKVIIVGITPGWTQTDLSFRIVNNALNENKSWEYALKMVKMQASFAGSMRSNMIKMLDEIGLNNKLGIESTKTLFSDHSSLLHSTSYLKYPVFKNGQNYTGSNPTPLKSHLWENILNNFVPEISNFENCLIIPLGKSAKKVFFKLNSEGKLKSNIYLENFPHPSGANGNRLNQFISFKDSMREQIKNWK